MKAIFSVDVNVFLGGAEKGGDTVIMFLIKVGVGAWVRKVNKTPTRRTHMALLWAEHRSHWWKLSRFWQGAYGFIYYCFVIRIELGYSNLLSEWREFAFLAFSILQNLPNWLHFFKYLLFPQRRNIIQAGKSFHMFKVIERPLQVWNARLFALCWIITDILYFGGQ